jgi:CHASE2 domain-containing sensor protein
MSNQDAKQPTKRPFHQRVGSRMAKYHRHFTKYLYERDTIFATLWVFIFIVVLGSLPINFYFLNPLKLALKDFDFNDITYAKLGKSADTPLDKRIVIINIGHADREELAMIIDRTSEMKAKAIGLDVTFEGGPSDDEHKDSLLRVAISRQSNMVVATRLDWDDPAELEKSGYFGDAIQKPGYTNLVGESKDERRTVRFYSVYEKEKKVRYESFGAALIKEYDEEAYKKLAERKKKLETINYSRHTSQYHIIDYQDLLSGGIEPSYIEGKIALLGYISLNPNDLEDKLYSPMNEKFAGKSTPDMNGIVIHANFISMVLDNDYIKKLPLWVNWLVAVLICWLHMSFFVRYYLENHIWFHLVAKIAQLISAIFFAYIGMLLFDRYNIKLDMKISLIVIVMAVDVIYFYEAFAVWLHKKFHYHTVFHQHHH